MYPFIEIFGKTISTYSIMAGVGVVLAVAFVLIRCQQKQYDYNKELYFFMFCMFFALAGAMLLYEITLLLGMIKDYKNYSTKSPIGLVYYGGLLGSLAGAMVYAGIFKTDVRNNVYISVPAIPLFHIFGRIGCFLSGCCHGMENHKFGIAFKNSVSALNNIPYLPIQLYEAVGNTFIFICLIIFQAKNKKYFKSLGMYFVMYGVLRFILEFFRGDAVRGIWGPFSTSQWISLMIIPFGIYCLLCSDEKNILNRMLNRDAPC